MIGLEVSKYRIHYGSCRDCEPKLTYVDESTLYIGDLESTLDKAYETAIHLGERMHREKAYGYTCYKKRDHIKLQLLIDNLENHIKQVKYGVEPCLSGYKLQQTYESLKQLIRENPCKGVKTNLTVDSSGVEEWREHNPYCLAYENWERVAYKVCGGIRIKARSSKTACDISYIVTSKEVDCSLQYAIESHKTDCKITFDVTEEEWNKGVKNTSYKDGKRLSKCGISFDHIVSMEKCGITTEYNSTKRCPQITYEGKTVILADLDTDKEFSAENACKYINQITL